MPTYFQGSEISDFPLVAGSVQYNTTSGRFNSINSRTSIDLNGENDIGVTYVGVDSFSATEMWLHWVDFRNHPYFSDSPGMIKRSVFITSNGTVLLAITKTTTNSLLVEKLSSGVWSTVLQTPINAVPYAQLTTFDLYLKMGYPGAISLYKNGGLLASDDFTNLSWSGVSSFTGIRFEAGIRGGGPHWGTCISEVIVASWNTIGSKLVTRAPSSVGTYSEWSGTYLDVDEIAPAVDFIQGSSANQRFSTGSSSFPALGLSEQVESVRISALTARDAYSPQKMNFFVRTNSTDYHATDQTVSGSLSHRGESWETNPSTTARWTIAQLNATEFGVRARN